MRKRRHPEEKTAIKKTYYQTKGKTHLRAPLSLAADPDHPKTWCGLKVEDCNNLTSKTEDCTCQKCLMVATGTWRKKK